MVIGPLNGQPTLMVCVGNQHQHSIVDTEFRIMFMRDEPLVEGGDFRYFYTLKLAEGRRTARPGFRGRGRTVESRKSKDRRQETRHGQVGTVAGGPGSSVGTGLQPGVATHPDASAPGTVTTFVCLVSDLRPEQGRFRPAHPASHPI
jgi:hypothetical protein